MYQVSSKISTKILSVLRMKLISLEERRQLTCRGKHNDVLIVPPLGVNPYLQNATFQLPTTHQDHHRFWYFIAAEVKLELRDGQ